MNFVGEDTPSNAGNSDDTSVHEDMAESDEQPLLAHMTKKKPLPPGNVKHLLSSTSAKPNKAGPPHEVILNSITYRQVNMASRMYSVSSCHAAEHKGSLVDCGANGGIAGDDVHIIDKTDRSVDIQDIDNHKINEILIVTTGGIINTQRGPVIAIMHQYAYTGKGKSIHSCAQMEAHKQTAHDKSTKVGGSSALRPLTVMSFLLTSEVVYPTCLSGHSPTRNGMICHMLS